MNPPTASGVTRRAFVKAAAATAAVPVILPSASLARSARNDQLGIAFIGCGKRAFELIGPFLDRVDVRVLAVCDVDTTRREHVKGKVDAKYGNSDCAAVNDYREVLTRGDVDAVVITTPDHWHINQVIDAAKAKKDIYCEKPLTLTLRECKLMIDAVRKHDRVFQTGSQQRTEYGGKFRTACEYVRSGRIGTIHAVHVGVAESSRSCDLPAEEIEPGLDWDRWLGPAPLRAYHSALSPRGVHNHYPTWRAYREYSGGYLTDMGAHHFDIAQWGLGMDGSGPVEVVPPAEERAMHGAKVVYVSGVEVFHGGASGTTFVGSRGVLLVDRDRIDSFPKSILEEPLGEGDVHLPRAKDHISDWLDCIRSRTRCICDVEVGARSIAVCHLLNLAYWHRRRLKWDPVEWTFHGDKAARGWMDYERRRGFELPPM